MFYVCVCFCVNWLFDWYKCISDWEGCRIAMRCCHISTISLSTALLRFPATSLETRVNWSLLSLTLIIFFRNSGIISVFIAVCSLFLFLATSFLRLVTLYCFMMHPLFSHLAFVVWIFKGERTEMKFSGIEWME